MIPHVNDSKQDLVDDEKNTYDYEKNAKKINWYHKLLLNRPLRVAIGLLLTGMLVPVLVYHYVFAYSGDQIPGDGYSLGSCIIVRSARLPCGNGSMPQEDCHPQCCYDLNTNNCYHRLPSRFSYIFNQPWTEDIVLLPRITTVPYRFESSTLAIKISVDEISSTHLSLTFYDAQTTLLNGRRIENKTYTYAILPQELSININSMQGSIFQTVGGPLIAANNIWEIAFKLTDESMYGLGEIPLKEGAVKILYNHDGGLSSIPLIFAKSNGSYHGLLIDSNEPTEVTVHGQNQVVVRSITKEGIKFHVFVGPKPSDVMKDAKKLVGTYQNLEYWMLGAHICNEIEETFEEAYEYLGDFVTSASQEQLPYESLCGTGPIIYENKCTTEERFMDEGGLLVRNANKRFIPHLSPYMLPNIMYGKRGASITLKKKLMLVIPSDYGSTWKFTIRFGKHNVTIEEDLQDSGEVIQKSGEILENSTASTTPKDVCIDMVQDFEEFMIRDSNSEDVFKALIGDYDVIYPDYENITQEFLQSVWPLNIDLDGIYLENTWPLDESIKNHSYTRLAFPYFNKHFEIVLNSTLLWNTTYPNGEIYYRKHNQYSNNFINAVNFASSGIPAWTTSQWMRGDVMINRQNIPTSWANLRRELVEAALGGISGHWLWSIPLCGDTEHYNNITQIELCLKWYMAGTYMPMIKIHSKLVERHPLSFEGINRLLTINALKRRLSLLPYYYTVLQNGPLLRPMFYQFPSSEALVNSSTQFSVGEQLLIVPNLQPSQSHVHFLLPPGTWYEFWSGLKLDGEEGDVVTMTTTVSEFLTLIQGGSIVPMQKDAKVTAEETRLQSSFSLIIAIGCELKNITDQFNETTQENICRATGELYMTENMTLIFEADIESLSITAVGEGFEAFCSSTAIWANNINELKIYGLDAERNTYDHHKQVSESINLCQLETTPEIVFNF